MTFASRRTPGWNSWSATCAPVRFNQLVREAFADLPRGADFGVVVMVRVFVGLVIVGGAPAASGLRRRRPDLPAVRQRARRAHRADVESVAAALHDADGHPLPSPQRGRRAPAAAHAGAAHLDGRCGRRRRVDGVAGRTGGAGLQTRTSGRCPATTRSWRTWPRRPTSWGQESVGQRPRWEGGPAVLAGLWPQLVGLRTGGARLRFRMDGAFFRQDVLRWLQGRGVGYAIKVPFYRWLDLQRYIRDSPTWVPVAPGVTGFAVPGARRPGTSP